MTRTVHIRISDANGTAAPIHMRGILRGVTYTVNHDIVQLDIALCQKADIGAKRGCRNVPNGNAANIRRKPLHLEGIFQNTAKSRQRDGIILGKARDIFNRNIVTALAQVDTVRIFTSISLYLERESP